jgi:hypothetical protein
MSKDLEAVKALGIERVHAETHISHNNLEAIFNKEFGRIHAVQFLGFISILEREYGADLSELREEFARYREEHAEEEPEQVIVPPSFQPAKKRRGWMYGLAAAVALLWLFYQFSGSGRPAEAPAAAPTETVGAAAAEEAVAQPDAQVEEAADAEVDKPAAEAVDASVDAGVDEQVDETAVEPAVGEGLPDAAPADQGLEQPAMAEAAVEEDLPEVEPMEEPVSEAVHDTLTIIPKLKLWVGMINLDTGKRKPMVLTDPFEIDTSHSWLFLFGHGHFKIEHNGEIMDLSSKNRIRFLYEDGIMQQLRPSEFRERNGGKEW